MNDTEVPAAPAAPVVLAARERPLWRVVLALALPVLAHQYLILSVSLSDRYLPGRYAGHAEHPAAYQSAQTTANYIAWLIGSFTVLVSVGSTALVARFTGARDRAPAVHVTNQSIVLAVGLGAAGSVAGLAGVD